jgi:hypothetical protein
LYPIAQQVLPAGVQLILLDEQEKLEMQAEAGKHDESLKFKFTGELKETFSIKVCWGNVQIIETFIVD